LREWGCLEAQPPDVPIRFSISLNDCHSERSEESHTLSQFVGTENPKNLSLGNNYCIQFLYFALR
jgi:type 1 fimbria pilin